MKLDTGEHTLTAIFVPDDAANYSVAQASVQLTVSQRKAAIVWPEPAPIVYGTGLGVAQLSATAAVSGSFAYSPAEGTMLAAGRHTLTVTFTPEDKISYAVTQATTAITVERATPELRFASPASIVYGTKLSPTQLGAMASLPGVFTYSPGAGATPTAGRHTLTATFTPDDAINYTSAQISAELLVVKAAPIVTWSIPKSIAYGAELGAEQLNATASAEGTFLYTPAAGSMLSAGKHRLSVIFMPSDATNYAPAQASVELVVQKVAPVVSWPTPNSLGYGAELGAAQLNASSSVLGSFVYRPAAGERLAVGRHKLCAMFMPLDAVNYSSAQVETQLTITKASPVSLVWPTPAPIVHGEPLTATQLNAKAPIRGKFVYSPAAGTLLDAGMRKLSVIFTPEDSHFPSAEASVILVVNKATPSVNWERPQPISYGEVLGEAQLNAKASAPGSFVYTPTKGSMLSSGKQTLSVTFVPENSVNYSRVDAEVELIVKKASPALRWPAPLPISYGNALSETQLNAKALVPGKFLYAPAAGTILCVGTHKLSALFAPVDSANYSSAEAAVTIVVDDLSNIDSFAATATHPPQEATRTQATVTPINIGITALSSVHKAPKLPSDPAPETRVYKGARYKKGQDGQWHLLMS
jgi:hypothetical protein